MSYKRSRGSIAAMTVVTSAVLLILGAGALKIATNNLNTDVNYRNGVAAQYLAEAGAQRMYVALMSNPNNTIATVTVTKNVGTTTAGTYEANVTPDPSDINQLVLYSKGTVDGAVRVIRTIMVKGTKPVGGGYSTTNATTTGGPGEGSIPLPLSVEVGVFSGGSTTANQNGTFTTDMYSNGSTTLQGNETTGNVTTVAAFTVNNKSTIGTIRSNGAVVINGATTTKNIYSNNSVTVNSNGASIGNIAAAGTITVWGGNTGTRTPNTPQTVLLPLTYNPPSSTNANAALNRNTYIGSPAPPINNATLSSSKYYLSGNYVIDNNVNLNIAGDSIIYIAGDVVFNNKVTFVGNVTLLVEGNVTFHNTAVFNNGMIASGGNIVFNNSLTMRGALLASKDITFNNNTDFAYYLRPMAGTTVLDYYNQ